MEPNTLSASAGLVFEACQARYKSEYIDRIPDVSGSAAAIGTCCHEVLDWWVKNDHHLKESDFSVMETFYKIVYYEYFIDNSKLADGLKMLERWYERQDWYGREVYSTEVKETFDLKYKYEGQDCVLPFTYIWDRCDLRGNHHEVVEVVDYKTVALPIQPEELKQRIQPRAYALAAQIKFPKAEKIWVTYDLLRYDQVGVSFSREDNVATYRYLQEMAVRIRASDGTVEKLNPECRWCVRKGVCDTLAKHASVGGVLALADIEVAVDLRARNEAAIGALRNQQQQLDDFILDWMKENERIEVRTANTIAKASMRETRRVDSERIMPMLPADILTRYAKIGVTELDEILKSEDLTDDVKSQIKSYIRKQPGAVSIKTKPVTALTEDP